MPAKIELTRVQRDCLDAKGICDGCPNNILESGSCQVKYTKGVAKKLGLREKTPTTPGKLNKPLTVACGCCGEAFETWFKASKFCPRCAAMKKSKSESLRACGICGAKFFGTQQIRCADCRAEGRRVSA